VAALARDYMVYALALSPDGKTLVTGSWYGVTTVWDVPSRTVRTRFLGHIRNTITVGYAPDGRHFASAGWDGVVKVWDARTFKESAVLPNPDNRGGLLWSVAFSPDSKTIASGGANGFISPKAEVLGKIEGTVRLWDVATQKLKANLRHGDAVYSVVFSPDGRFVASGSLDHTVKLWDVATGRELALLSGHTGAVHAVRFSPDGKTLASGSFDGTVRLWDVPSGRERETFRGHTDRVTTLAFSPDGKTLASAGYDHLVRLWKIEK
jgi:WD40 repeat protein